MKNKTLEIILGVAVIAGIVFGVLYFTKKPEVAVNDSAIRNTFVSSCANGGSTFTVCDCAYTTLKTKLGLDGFIAMSVKYDQDKVMPDYVFGIISACLNK